MLRNNSIANKFFLGFFFTSAIAVISMMLIIYFSIKSNIIESKVKQLEVLHNIKYKQVQDAIQRLQNPFLKFIKDNRELYGFNTLASTYNHISDSFSSKDIANCKQELIKHYSGKFTNEPVIDYMRISVQDGIPQSNNGIVAQCSKLNKIVEILSLKNIDFNQDRIKIYEKQYSKIQKALQIFLSSEQFESILFISKNDEVIFSSDRNSIVGHNVVSSMWTKGLAQQISKFHTMTSYGSQKYYYVDMQPYLPLNGYPVFFIIAPIFEQKEYQGSIVLVVSSLYLDNILSDNNNWLQAGFGKTGDAYLTSDSGVFRSNKRQFIEDKDNYLSVLRSVNRPTIMYDMIARFGTLATYASIMRPAHSKVFTGGRDYEIYTSVDDVEVISYYTPINIGNLSWILFVRMEMSEVLEDLNGIKKLMQSLVIPVFIILFFITGLLTYLTTKPIRQMKNICSALAQGEKCELIPKGNYKEINELINSFNSMLTTLRENDIRTKYAQHELEDSLMHQAVISQELKEERDFIRRILDSKGVFIFIIDENDKIIRTNNVMNKVYPGRKIIGEYYQSFLPEENRRRVAYIMSLLREGSENIPNFVSTDVYNGKSIYIEWNFSTFMGKNINDGHQEVYITAIGVNITERYEAEQLSKENAAMFHTIFSKAYDAVLITDENNNIMLVNKSFESLFKLDYMEIVGKPIIPVIFSDEYKNVLLTDTNEGKTIELDAVKADNSKFPVDLSISKIIYKGKLSILYIIRDSSHRKQREDELHKALNRVQEAEKNKSEFLASMSHELRTPINGIIGFIDLLKDTKLDAAQQEYIKIISASTENLFNIMDDILDFSKIESGKMQLENIDFNAWSVFEESASLFAAKAMDKNIILISFFSIDTPKYLVGDPLRIRQIITNLISNAIKFTDNNGRVILRISIIEQDKESCKLRISVKDNGIGITQEQQQIIIDSFAHSEISSIKYGGTGLGLAISQSLASAMGSNLNLYSEYGHGSEFYFTLNLPISYKKDKRSKTDFSSTHILLFGCSEDCPAKELYEEYFRNLKTQVKYSIDEKELKDKKYNIIGINCDSNEYSFVENVIKQHNDKYFILFTVTPINNKFLNIKGDNVYHLMPPFTVTKLIDTLSDISGINKTIQIRNKKEKRHRYTGNVLLVDDNDVNLKLAEMMLTNIGLSVELAENGNTALEKYKKNSYDVIFMDIYMPVMDGLEAAKEIIEFEKDNSKPHTPIIALTADTVREDIEIYISAGMDDFISKPIVKSKLEAVLGRYIVKEEPSLDDEIIQAVSVSIGNNNEEAINKAINDYCYAAWHYTQNLFHAVNELNEGSSLYIIEQLINMSETYKFRRTIKILKKIRENVENGINETIYTEIEALKDAIYKIKRSIRYKQ